MRWLKEMRTKPVKDFALFLLGIVIGCGVLILNGYYKYGVVDYPLIIVSIAVVSILKLLSVLWEKRWGSKTEKLAKEMYSKEERAKSRNYAMTVGFSKLHGKSMKEDLIYRVQKGCLSPLLVGVLLIVVGIVPSEGELPVRIVIIIIGAGALSYGIYRFTGQPVRRFLKKAEKEGKDIETINADYMNGRLLADRHSCVMIGEKYTVCLNSACNIFAFENSQISLALIRINAKRIYVKGMFSGGDRQFEIVFLLKDRQNVGDGISTREISAGIRRFQTELAYEEYMRHGIEVKAGFVKQD